MGGELARGMMGVVVSVGLWSGSGGLSAFRLRVIARQCRTRAGGWKGARGGGKAVTSGGKVASETRKKKTRQKGLVRSPSLGSALWFTGFGASPPRNASRHDRLRGVCVEQAPATCGGWIGVGPALLGRAVGQGAPVFPATVEIGER